MAQPGAPTTARHQLVAHQTQRRLVESPPTGCSHKERTKSHLAGPAVVVDPKAPLGTGPEQEEAEACLRQGDHMVPAVMIPRIKSQGRWALAAEAPLVA